jgi:hypothetical protein
MRLQGATVKIVSEPDMSDEDPQIVDLQEVAITQDRIQQMSVSDAKFTAWIKHVSWNQTVSGSFHAEPESKGVFPYERARTAWQLQPCPSC